jgi:hypothetical protein
MLRLEPNLGQTPYSAGAAAHSANSIGFFRFCRGELRTQVLRARIPIATIDHQRLWGYGCDVYAIGMIFPEAMMHAA